MELYRIMAIDYGEKRIGIALSDLTRTISRPYQVLANDVDFWDNLKQIVKEQKVEEVAIGLPQNFAGEDTKKTLEVRAFAEKFSKRFEIKWEFCDENFTSEDGNAALKQMGFSLKDSKKVIDKVAAALILRNYLEFK